MMIRIKEVKIDNLTIALASLTMAEADAVIGRPVTIEHVCVGLNRARKDGEAEWTVERMQAEFDYPTLAKLREELLALSGLQTGSQPVGEIRAAAPTSSANSAAA